MSEGIKKRRIFELDLLRGFFICVIILDHLQFWPSPWQYMTGQGRLWVSAAEGFFLISGLLIGYLRAYKGAKVPLKSLSKILISRGVMLYVWCVIITFVVVSLSVLLPNPSGFLPKLPNSEQVVNLPTYIWNVLTTSYASDWIYFLRMYAVMLVITPLFLWLIRKKLWWVAVALSLSIYAISLLANINEAVLQWQILFFGSALIGWKFETILAWLNKRPLIRKTLVITLITTTLLSMALSYFMVHGWSYVEDPSTTISRESYVSVRTQIDPLFSNNPLVPLRIGLSFLWFAGLLALFHVIRNWLMKWLKWLLLPFGQASLTAYCIQAVLLCFAVAYIPYTKNFWLNGLIGLVVLLFTNWLIRQKITQRVFPR